MNTFFDKWAKSCPLALSQLQGKVSSIGVGVITVMLSLSASAMEYVATPEQSEWVMAEDTPLECRMTHTIPYFGQVEFASVASKKKNLDLSLKMNRPMGSTENVSLVSMPALWQPGVSARTMDQLKFYQQFDGYIGGQTAWSVLSELEKGRVPTFNFNDWHAQSQHVQVALSPVRFRNTYNDFSICISQLLPYTFEDISFTILHYTRNSDELTKASKKRLAQIAEYVRHNQDIDLVLISTYTDSFGERADNQELAEKRAVVLREYFQSLGLEEGRIQIQGYGERRPIADNRSQIGKDKNRRVVISLGRTAI